MDRRRSRLREPGGVGYDASDAPSSLAGPMGWLNWRSYTNGQLLQDRAEFMLYSDARFIAHLTAVGPYDFLNTIGSQNYAPTDCGPGIVLRVGNHLAQRRDRTSETRRDDASYHGGELDDELASVLGLILGRRVRSGGLVRRFDGNDPLGLPIEALHEPPVLPPPSSRYRGVLPALALEADLREARTPLEQYASLDPSEAIAFARAARLYQEALWVAEVQPHLAWVLLVSAVEAVAGLLSPVDDVGDVARHLREAHPDLFTHLDQPGQQEVRSEVVKAFGNTVGATRRFVRFLVTYLPDPPPNGPSQAFLVKWSKQALRKHLRCIYNYRSRALHDGLPFPEPMCSPPYLLDDGTISQKPIGLSAWAKSGFWMADDLPMLLHTFAYIVRGSVVGWLGKNHTEERMADELHPR